MALSYTDRSERGKLRFSGEQDLWFLHQIMTQAFEDMAPGEARDTAMLTAHGRMVGYMETVRTEDAVLAHFEPSLKEGFPEAIRRYVFATRVEIEDVDQDFALILLAGEGWEEAAAAAGGIAHPTRGLGAAAGYLWVPIGDKAAALDELRAAGAQEASEDELERIRIEHGAPRWGFDMDLKTIPQEAGVDAWAVHFEKGCYVGQEAMAKIHFRGKVNKRLARIAGVGLEPGADVMLDGAKVGTVTSSAGDVGLAVIRYTVEPGELVSVGGSDAKVTA